MDIEKLKTYIGEGYEKVFNSITAFNCDALGRPTTLTLLNHFPNIQTLSMTCRSNEMLIQTITRMKELTALQMTNCEFENSSQLSRIFQMDTLRELHLSGDLGFLSICQQYLQGSKLEKLSLAPDSLCLAFDDFPVLSELRELDLTTTYIPTEALNNLQLPELQKLKLNLEYSSITDLTLPGLPKLQYVDLSCTNVTSDTLKTLHTKNILGLNLVGCKKIQSLDFLSSMPQLEQLSLSSIEVINTVGFAGSFSFLTSLRFLALRSYRLSESAPRPYDVEQLLKAFPHLKKFSLTLNRAYLEMMSFISILIRQERS